MIIDLHTQVWASPDQLGREIPNLIRQQKSEHWGQWDGSPSEHEQAMACVDGALIFGFRSDRLGAHVPSDYIAEFVEQDPHRRAGVAGIDPMTADAVDEVDGALDRGFVGVSISPAMQGFHPAHSDATTIYERCVETGTPLFISIGDPLPASAMMEFGRPHLWDEIARTYPTLRIIFSQLGWPWIDEVLCLAGKHEYVFADISGLSSRPWLLYHALLNAMGLRVMDKLLFGSGFPRETPAKTIETLYTINSYSHGTQLPSIPRSNLRSIIERDALARLGIRSDLARTRSRRADGAPPVEQPVAVPKADRAGST